MVTMKPLLPSCFVALLTVGLGGELLTPATANAGETCNYVNHNLFMAQAFQNERQVWVSEGWWVIQPGDCVVYADNAVTYFKIEEGVTPPRPVLDTATKMNLCVVNDRFTVVQADNAGACGDADGAMVTFLNPGTTLELIKSP
jgi:uncharacterized membrane protein